MKDTFSYTSTQFTEVFYQLITEYLKAYYFSL